MRDRFRRSMERLLASQERLSELFWPFARMPGPKPRTRRKPTTIPPLVEIADFGPNPGNLRMLAHIPEGLAAGAPLVVVLHGCRQTAESYDRAAGWTALADERGFAVLYAEQKETNNPRRCFNWFRPSEVTRGRGELMSIRQMIAHLSGQAASDPERIYVTGLSAGGAMTSALLANYPALFAGGAIIAGLPFGAARDATHAFEAMAQAPAHTATEWGDLVRKASPDIAPGPLVSVWHGTADETVSISNAAAILRQWADVYGLDPLGYAESRTKGRRTRRWRDADGRVLMEYHEIAGLGHGTPVERGEGGGYALRKEPFMLEAGFSSTLEIARGWGLLHRR
ncbi:MAG: PHB depolymerase family esterase [Shinella sp.]|nr:PHB depolymerase family esterase [Shinella sp.]